MSQADDISPKYEAGFHDAVRRLLGPHPHGWTTATYSDEHAIEVALRRAYHEGRIDGISWALGPSPAPGPVGVAEDVLPTVEGEWERLGLFEAPGASPGPISAYLEAWRSVPVVDAPAGNVRVWAIRHAMSLLGDSLAEATEFVNEMGVR